MAEQSTENDGVGIYSELLLQYGVRSTEAEAYKRIHANDPAFVQRCTDIERYFTYKDPLLEELDRVEK